MGLDLSAKPGNGGKGCKMIIAALIMGLLAADSVVCAQCCQAGKVSNC